MKPGGQAGLCALQGPVTGSGLPPLGPQVIPREDSAESWPPDSPAAEARSPSVLEGGGHHSVHCRRCAREGGAASSPRAAPSSALKLQRGGVVLAPVCSVSEYRPFGGELGSWPGEDVGPAPCSGFDSQWGREGLPICLWSRPRLVFAGVGGLGLGPPNPCLSGPREAVSG